MTDNLCKNNEGGQPCEETAVAGLVVTIGGDPYDAAGTIDLCLSHLLGVMIRNGCDPQKAVDVVSAIGHRIALDILDEERKQADSENHHPSYQ